MIKAQNNTGRFIEIRNLIALIGLGLAMSLSPILLLFYFAGLNIYFFNNYFKTLNIVYLIQLLFFLPSIEISRRVLSLGIIPYEIGKYMCLFYFIIFSMDKRIHTQKISTLFLFLFLFVFPSTLFMDLDNFQKKIVFSLMGIMNLALLGIFFSRVVLTTNEFKSILKRFILSIVPFLAIITIRTPSFSEIDFDLGANSITSAGFGPNQVATVFGAAIFVIIVYQIVFKGSLFQFVKGLDIILLSAFSLRALLTFSRGGVLAPIMAFILPINILSKVQNIQKIIKNLTLISVLALVAFFSINFLTGGLLLSRYKGETAGTIARSEETTLEEATSGRTGIIENDFQIWLDNFIFGVGPGESPNYRDNYNFTGNKVTHTEFSRLLSEHGVFGFLINILLIIIIPFKILNSQLSPQVKYIKLALVLFAIFSMMHSAMRTVIPVIFYAFSAVNFEDKKKASKA
jgi:hypothetical protein